MKSKPVGEFLALFILMCIGLLFIIRISKYGGEGFADASSSEQAAYDSLKIRLKTETEPYCQIANLVQEQMIQAYMTSKVETPPPTPPPNPISPPKFNPSDASDKASEKKGWWGDSSAAVIPPLDMGAPLTAPSSDTPDVSVESAPAETQKNAQNHLMQTYQQVYSCTDELKGLRPQCNNVLGLLSGSGTSSRADWKYVPCTGYNLPAYDPEDTNPMLIALMNIPDNTPDKLQMELAWFQSVIKQLQDGIDAGANPPASFPKDDSGNLKLPTEGFYDAGKCSAEAMALKRKAVKKVDNSAEINRRRKLQAEAASCTVPTLQSEVDRVNAILDSKSFSDAMKQSQSIYATAMKLQSDLAKLNAGTLYSWQQSGPKKSYSRFKGGDRTAAFLASVSQNRDFS